jgi:hypothetical protein
VKSLNDTEYPSIESDDLVIRAVGPATEGGRLPLSELARLAGGLQATLERIALSISGGLTRPGRRPREIVDAVRLDFVEFRPGSAVLKVARTGQLSLDDLLSTSLDALEEGINELRQNPSEPPRHFTPQIINGIRDLTGGISTNNVTRIEFWRTGTIRFTIDETLQAAVRAIRFQPEQENVTIVGRLHMGDFSPAGLRCRIDTYAGSVLCDFTSDLRNAVLDAMDEIVMAEGRGEIELNGTTVRVLHLARLEALNSARPRSLDSLAREQHVQPLSSLAELGGLPVDDFDEFLTAIKSARSGDE